MTKTPIALSSLGALVFVLAACGPNVVATTVRVDADAPTASSDEGDADEEITPVDGDPGEDGPSFEGEAEEPVVDIEEEEGIEPGEPDVEGEEGTSDIGGAQALAAATCGSNAHTGDYCGGDKNNGNPSTLYRCNGPGPATVIRSCANGCKVAPAGEDDYCKPPPPPTCDSNASTGDYCGGDKVSHANPNKLYRCNGPGPATVIQTCSESCVVAPAGQDDFCEAPSAGDCAHHSQLKFGLAPAQSDHMRCAGITAAGISQTIGNAAASAGTHAQDGTSGGFAYCAATDIRTAGLTNTQVRALLNRLADEGFAAFFRNPGHDGWPSSEARHIHAIYVGVHMKSTLRAQVQDWLNGKNGLVSHTTYSFWQASNTQKNRIRDLFNAHN